MAFLVRKCLFVVGLILFASTIAPWVFGYLVIIGGGPSETVSVRQTGMVTSPEILKWSAWESGPSPVTHGQWAWKIPSDAKIIAHRTGHDSKLFVELTLYQAKYQLSDGRIDIAPADGPKPLISIKQTTAVTWAVLSLLAGIACMFMAMRPIPINRVERMQI